MRNEITRYLAGKPLRAFKFIGITGSCLAESLRLFGGIFGLSVPGSPPRENVNPHWRGTGYQIPDWLHAHLEALNAEDLASYALATVELECGLASTPRPGPRPAGAGAAGRTGGSSRQGGGEQAFSSWSR